MKTAPCPHHLEKIERDLWRKLASEYDFSDTASLELLKTALETHQCARRCRENIDRDGETFFDRFKQPKPHPLLAAERDARAAFLSALRILNLDLTGDRK